MKRINRVISFLVVFCLTFCSFFILGAQKPEAASGKTVYVMTRLVINDYDPDDDESIDMSKATYTCSYDKKGLLKSSTMKTDDGKIKLKSTFKYGKSSGLKSCKTKSYYKGKNLNVDTSKKFTVNSKGFVTKIKSYNEKGKVNASAKYTWNKKGILTRSRFYSEKGKLTETIKYTLNSDGSIKEEKHFKASGKLDERIVYETSGNVQTITEYDDDGDIDSKVIATFKNGRMITMKEYDDDGKLKASAKFTYKKVKTTKKNHVKSQQSLITKLELL